MSFVVPAGAKSWIDVLADSHFPIQNLPYCFFKERQDVGGRHMPHLGVRIGDYVVDVSALAESGATPLPYRDRTYWFYAESILDNSPDDLSRLRQFLFESLSVEGQASSPIKASAGTLFPIKDVVLHRRATIPAFVDFYSGINHASNVGRMFRPDQPPLLPNYKHLPVGYNGRASSVVISGTDIRRPSGQQKVGEEVVFGPTQELDFELEMGFFTASGNEMGKPIPIGKAEEHILGVVLVNDWSARDMQRWEYVPLGPFLAKSFATSISPYVVTLDALEPFRVQGMPQDPEPFPHLRNPKPAHYDITLEVSLQTQKMSKPQIICRSNAKHLYWSFLQQLAHQTSNGTPVEAGDLYASGTISGTEEDSFGSMLELCWKGTKPLTMGETAETRTWLQDGDTLILSGYCQGDGYRVGFGECRGTVLPAP